MLDRDNVNIPKQEWIKTWETPDFFEFDRPFKCNRAEFIYLIKGICYEKLFNTVIQSDNQCRTYRLITFRCSDLVHKKKTKKDKSKPNERCTFYLQYVEEPDRPDEFRLHSYDSKHKHELDADIPMNMTDYFTKQTSTTYKYNAGQKAGFKRREWKGEFMKSLTYELTTIYADQMAQ